MAKPWHFCRNRPNPEGPVDGDEEEGGVDTDRGIGREGGGGKERATHNTPPPAEAAAGTGRANRPVRREQKLQRKRSLRGRKRPEEGT